MNCKPGDLAIIVRCDNQEDIGKIVSVVQFVGRVYSDCGLYYIENAWEVEATTSQRLDVIWCVQDDCMRPISGLPDTQDTDQHQPIEELA